MHHREPVAFSSFVSYASFGCSLCSRMKFIKLSLWFFSKISILDINISIFAVRLGIQLICYSEFVLFDALKFFSYELWSEKVSERLIVLDLWYYSIDLNYEIRLNYLLFYVVHCKFCCVVRYCNKIVIHHNFLICADSFNLKQ